MEKKNFTVGRNEALIMLLVMLVVMGLGVIKFGLSPQVPVMAVMGILMAWGVFHKLPWSMINTGIKDGIETGIVPIFIFILVGALISTWIAAGIIPSLMVFGFHLISVQWFVPSVFIVCALVGSAVGSAFTVISTVGIAFFGMGVTMHVNPALVAGAIISGAVFGDKSSPLSESTNLTAAVVDADLFKHIINLMWSTVPAFVISLIVFGVMGSGEKGASLASINRVIDILETHFTISAWAIVPIACMFICAWRRVPAIPTLFLNIGVSLVMLLIEHPGTKLMKIASIIETGFVSHTGNKEVDVLLSRGGIASMMGTVSLIVLTLSLGGMLMQFGLIDAVMEPFAKHLNSDGKRISAVVLASIGVNIFIGEQFLSVILPGKAFKKTFDDAGLAPVALGRALEDGGTVINYLVPWGVAGVFAANTLGVSTMAFLPFTLFSLLSPVFSILSGVTGIGVKHQEKRVEG
ncbi:Na+/H+ antiporter NhaC [Furfurilactobacillus siliginis]|uniref:Na+/H+ antiporter NhaC n=1 Tax=Furfurilactobacillus siliginis TaxID=348151 RepID=A0A0R2L4C1_9LACO|nr:Na+/H+ antiporter NhaC [Furfurilactobacillus siliginis]KRN96623.1 nhaC protein [Furfurilactobacillus siliginis]GEK29385.1 Na+/H+ antiporter NhaC [Furfurilactobacillus siliginis]